MSTRQARTATPTIASGTALSESRFLNGDTLDRILMPAGWDAADITVQVSHDGQAWYELTDAAGNAVALTVAASRAVQLGWAGITHIRFRSGTSGVPVNQTADRVLTLCSHAVI